jgi:diketogulonate reductase-like aldo/keto reductase
VAENAYRAVKWALEVGCTCKCWRCTLTLPRSCRLDIVISSAASSLSYFPLSHTGNDIKDSAEWYENEHECGRAILDFCIESGVSRADIFFTTKLKYNAGFDATVNAINRSLELCGLDYIDLYLIHGPWGGPDARRQAWEACVAAQKAGKVKSIGISTFGIRHMQELFDSGQLPPAVHQVRTIQSLVGITSLYKILPQIDLHPFMTRTEIVKFSRDHGIVLEVYSLP